MTSKNKEPEDLGIKVGTKEEAAWTEIKKSAEKELEQGKRALLITAEVIKLADKMILESK